MPPPGFPHADAESQHVRGTRLIETKGTVQKTVSTGNSRKDDNTFNGTRKLIRPHLSLIERKRDPVHMEDPLTHANIDGHSTLEASHAEAFYFQKQMQQQTEMLVVLDDGEELRGIIQWYDKSVLKLLVGRNRVMIYKSGIKYLYKSSEAFPVGNVMK
jgi:sRNA-binding regulator protein Hfq